jgi:D-tagatose-1,6-bisphosphate aldolase subunit GatZ/KbaZ
MYLDEIVIAQKRDEAKGIVSVCSSHPWVLKAAMREIAGPLLIEATCNQVNQFGGYTGMKPVDFVGYVRGIAKESNYPFENIILGGDHLGPSVWQNEPAESAMQKAETMVRNYVEAGFVKIHLDCSMRLADDPESALDVELSARRAARLARVAETFGNENLRYVIGTEVPIPGGSTDHEEGVSVTKVEDVRQTIEVTHDALLRHGLEAAWERVLAVVVQPGVEFGDDFVLGYRPEAARDLVRFIASKPQLVYEAHSTDYQMPQALQNLVRDHFAILKVGPALTFAFREAVFALAMMENVLFPPDERSNLISVLDEVMVRHPEHWKKYYHGTPEQRAYKRKYSMSDRVRYYWSMPEIHLAFEHLLKNLGGKPLPLSLVSQFLPVEFARIRAGKLNNDPRVVMWDKVKGVLVDYTSACA